MLRTLIDSLPDSIYIKDLDHRMTLCNTGQARLLGAATPAEAVGKSDRDFYPRELAEQYESSEDRLFATGEPLLNHEERVADQQTGKLLWYSNNKVPLYNADGKITSLVGIGRDITALKQAAEALAAANAEMEQAAHKAHELAVAAESGQRGQV